MEIVFEISDKNGKNILLSNERYKHIKRHPHMNDSVDIIKNAIQKPTAIRYNKEDESVAFFFREHKENEPSERYLLVSVKYLNSKGFIITSFFTNRITGEKWKI